MDEPTRPRSTWGRPTRRVLARPVMVVTVRREGESSTFRVSVFGTPCLDAGWAPRVRIPAIGWHRVDGGSRSTRLTRTRTSSAVQG